MAKATRPNPAQKPIDKFTKEWEELGRKLSVSIRARINRGQAIRQAVAGAATQAKVSAKMEDFVMDAVEESVKRGGITLIGAPTSFRDWYLHEHWPGDEFTLSQRLGKAKYKGIIRDTILQQMKENRTIVQTAKALTDQELIKGQVAEPISELRRLARRVAKGDLQAQRSYSTALNDARRQVERLSGRGASAGAVKKAYANVIRASEKLSVQQMDKAITRAVLRKARYNAERIARTEAARAYGIAAQQSAEDDPDVKALRWELNPDHAIVDICDFHTEADLHGMGPGVYPIRQVPDYPAHPHCLCLLEEVFRVKKGRPIDPKTQLKRLNAERQQKLLGVEGRKKFLKNPNTWRKELKNYSGAPKQPRIPSKFVKGGTQP